MTIKKQFVELVNFLEDNKNKKVSTLLDEIMLMTSSKKKDTTYVLDQDGNTFAVFCWYHKQWELVSAVPFGSKANTKTGLNTMCKVGTSKWTKAQRDAKEANANLLTQVASGDIQPSDILAKQAEIELSRHTMDITDMPEGITVEALNEHIQKFNSAVTSS